MRKQYWTIIQPKGRVWMPRWWDTDKDAWWELKESSLEKSLRLLKFEGWRVVRIWVEVEEVV